MGLFSIVCLRVKTLFEAGKIEVEATAWYEKPAHTFFDVLRAVRQSIWDVSNYTVRGEKGLVEN
jgi:neutral trehalase